MEKIIVFVILLSTMLCSFSVHPADFSPLNSIVKLENGQQIMALFAKQNLDGESKRQQLNQLISPTEANQSAYYAFAYYRILHDIELSVSAPEAAELAIAKMLLVGQRLNTGWLIAEAKMWQATFAAKQSRFDEGLALIDEAIGLSKVAKFSHLTGRAYNAKAALYFFQDQYYIALEYYLRALNIFIANPEDPYVSKVLSNVAIIYVDLEDWEKALEANNNALAHVDKYGGSYEQIAAFNNNASFILGKLGRWSESKPYLISSRESALLSGNLRVKLNAQTSWIQYYLAQGEYRLAVEDGLECVDIALANQYPLFEGDCSRILAKAMIKVGQVDEALQFLAHSEALYKRIEKRSGLADTFNTYALAYEEKGDYKAALDYQRKANEEDKALLFDRRAKMTFDLSQRYQERYRQQELAVLKVENDLQESRLAEQELREKFLFFVILVSVISILLLIKKRLGLENDKKNLQSSNLELYKQSHIDLLTGLYNRRYFSDFLEQQRQLPQNQSMMSLAIIDIDHFKSVNDCFGHDVGDEVLIQVSNVINKNIRECDLIIRWGGEEFVLLLCWPNYSYPLATVDFYEHFERVRLAVENTDIVVGEHRLKVTISMGGAQPLEALVLTESWHQVLDEADKALYQAKADGRNCVVLAN
ncbi:diguanylate cyclase [uncultured Shewanella sp.]|uniref:tetratricopeptide repeat-containing diguanylate cyclase n=1 Tax=uncultured Shewanella sp. TaxID=173975 RepID=UPI00262B9980|nr:diguanylate cyclase [uncultured Shewanella sp.]